MDDVQTARQWYSYAVLIDNDQQRVQDLQKTIQFTLEPLPTLTIPTYDENPSTADVTLSSMQADFRSRNSALKARLESEAWTRRKTAYTTIATQFLSQARATRVELIHQLMTRAGN